MKSSINRRTFIKGSVLSSVGVAAVASQAGSTLAASSEWSAGNVSATTADGSITDVLIEKTNFDFTFTWTNVESGDRTVSFTIEARLPDDGRDWDSLGSGEFELGSAGDSKSYSNLNWNTQPNFPLGIITDHSTIVESDFQPSSGTKTTPVELRFTFDNGKSTAESTSSFEVSVSENGVWQILDGDSKTVDSGETLEVTGVEISGSGVGTVNGTLTVTG